MKEGSISDSRPLCSVCGDTCGDTWGHLECAQCLAPMCRTCDIEILTKGELKDAVYEYPNTIGCSMECLEAHSIQEALT